MQLLHILFPNASLAQIQLEQTVGDYWYVVCGSELYVGPHLSLLLGLILRTTWTRTRKMAQSVSIDK